MHILAMRASVLVLILNVSLSGCVQMPTASHTVVDQRPQIAIRFDAANRSLAEARVLIDGVDVGRAGDYRDGRASLRVLPGTHSVKIVLDDRVLLDERAYLADGVVRPFILN